MTAAGIAEEGLTIICIPVYNDWESVRALIVALSTASPGTGESFAVLLIDDGSTEPPPDDLATEGLDQVEVLRLRRNVGHQRAIAIGLSYLHRHRPCRTVVVMDGDGQDGAEDVPLLLKRCRENGGRTIVFARRTRRSEDLFFLAGYHAYRLIHRLLTGRRVEVGNFSAIPFALLDSLVGISELWNHYAAAVIHARLPVESIPIPRRRRIAGETRMNTATLMIHGLSAISVYSVTVVVRLMALTGGLFALTGAGVFALFCARLFTGVAIPSGIFAAAGFLAFALLSMLLLLLIFVLVLLGGRNGAPFLPIRDWEYYVIDLPRSAPASDAN